MSRFMLFSLVAFSAAILATASRADAQDYPGYWGYSCICAESAPYFALHPPVYYSLPVPRTYGYSPFPYPPGVLTPASNLPRPQVVRNVYGGREAPADDEIALRQPGPSPLTIINPFVEQSGKSAANWGTRRRQPAPQVVYPALLAGMSRKSQ